jgi:hypothetical protein
LPTANRHCASAVALKKQVWNGGKGYLEMFSEPVALSGAKSTFCQIVALHVGIAGTRISNDFFICTI